MPKIVPFPERFKTEPFRMHFSGVEGNTHFNVAKAAGVKHMLLSYFYIRRKGRKFLEERFGDGSIQLFVDSGAHTFMNDLDEYKDKPDSFWEDYIIKYLQWARNNSQFVFAMAELDVDVIVGKEKVKLWRKKYFEPFELETGIPVCYIWRSSTYTFKDWIDMCKTFNYLGFSGMNDDASVIAMRRLLSTAKKHGAVCHGMAMTKPSILPQLPFFSVDSISWKSGEMYGVTYVWDGHKLHTITKDKKVQARKRFKQKLLAQGCNWKLYIADDNNEVTRMTAIAWIQVMEWVKRKLKPKMYWLKSGSVRKSATSETNESTVSENAEGEENTVLAELTEKLKKQTLEETKFPSKEWFRGVMVDYLDVCTDLNIDQMYYSSKDKMVDLIKDVTYLLAEGYDDEAAEKFNIEYLKELSLLYFNTEAEDSRTVLVELYSLFEDVVTGKHPYFHYMKALEEEAGIETPPPPPKERPRYIEDNEEDEMDAKLEEELTKALVPVRDNQGRFLPGQSLIKKPKNIYSSKYPRLACDTCYAAQSCPEFKSGYLCAYNKTFKKFDTRNPEDIMNMLFSITNMNAERLQRAAIFETLEGGAVDANVSSLIQLQMSLLGQAKEVHRAMIPQNTSNTFKMTVESDSQQGPSILGSIFSNLGRPKPIEGEVIDVSPNEGDDDGDDV